MLKIIEKPNESDHDLENAQPCRLDEVLRQGAQRMLQTAIEVEVAEYMARHDEDRDENGRRLIVRNGTAQARTIVTGVGQMEIRAPRINDKRVVDGERQQLLSKILPPYMRKSLSMCGPMEFLSIFALRKIGCVYW